MRSIHYYTYLFCALLWVAPSTAVPFYPITFVDDAGRTITISAPPDSITSQVPMVADILAAIGAGQRLITDSGDLLFYAPGDTIQTPKATPSAYRIAVQQGEIAAGLKWIGRLGAITARGEQARELAARIRGDLAVAAAKTATLAADARIRMLGVRSTGDRIVPAIGPRQTDIVTRAGGHPAPTGGLSANEEVRQGALQGFDPQLIYAPLEQRREVLAGLQRSPWDQLSAVRNRHIYFFPARLLNHSLSGAGYLVNALASRAYPQLYTDPSNQVRPDRVVRSRRVPIDLAAVAHARINHHHRHDFISKTLVVDFTAPQKILSTLEGFRSGILTVGNHYAPPPCWWLAPHSGLAALREEVLPVIDRPAASTALLFTGADMDHLAVETASYREMRVSALVTAGVRGNAMRLSRDRGNYYEPGTINIILMTSMRLSDRAMSRALVTATEAKTAALWDLDIRSSYTPRQHAATGTGTDNLIVVENSAAVTRVDNSGGHTKMGELIATAVYGAVQGAIAGQNGITVDRGVAARLAERRIDIDRLAAQTKLPAGMTAQGFAAAIRRALRRPEAGDLLTAAMSLEDAAGRGLTRISAGYEGWCRQVAETIAGRPLTEMRPLVSAAAETPALYQALNAIWNGALAAESSASP